MVGSVVKIPLGGSLHTYGQILSEADVAFFDIEATEDVQVEEIVQRAVIFRIAVMNHAITKGRWPKVGTAPISPALAAPQPKFIQDPLDSSKLQIYLAGTIRPATRAECRDLERSAVWEPEHVEDRLRDHFAGRPNKWVEALRIR